MQGFFTACCGTGGGQALKMCRMPPKLRLDTPWPMHKAGLRATPAAVTFCEDVQMYAVLVTCQVLFHLNALLMHSYLFHTSLQSP